MTNKMQTAFRLNYTQAEALVASSFKYCSKNDVPFPVYNFVGPPGIGKTALVKTAAAKLGVTVIVVPIATYPYEDVRGLPMFVTTPDGKTVEYALGTWVPRDPDGSYIVCFDDASQATGDIQKILANIIYERKLDSYHFPKNTMFVCTGNRLSDRSGVVKSFDHLTNRQCVIEIQHDYQEWIMWAIANGVNEKVIAYIAWQKNSGLNDYAEVGKMPCATSRSWVSVSRQLDMFETGAADGVDEYTHQASIQGYIGGKAIEFNEFCNIYKNVPDVNEIMAHPKTTPVCDKLDLRYATAISIANAITEDNIENAVIYLSRKGEPSMGLDLGWTTLQLASSRNPKLYRTAAFRKWADENSKSLNGIVSSF